MTRARQPADGVFTLTMPTSAFSILRPPKAGTVCGPADALLIRMAHASNYGKGLLTEGRFLARKPSAEPWTITTVMRWSSRLGMTCTPMDSWRVFQGKDGSCVLLRVQGEQVTQVFPESLWSSHALKTLRPDRAARLREEVVALWNARAEGESLGYAVLPYIDLLPVPVWVNGDTTSSCATLMEDAHALSRHAFDVAHTRNVIPSLPSHLILSWVVWPGLAHRNGEGGVDVSAPTIRLVGRVKRWLPPTDLLAHDHPFCADLVDRYLTLPIARRALMDGFAKTTLAAAGTPEAIARCLITLPEIEWIDIRTQAAPTHHQRIARLHAWDTLATG